MGVDHWSPACSPISTPARAGIRGLWDRTQRLIDSVIQRFDIGLFVVNAPFLSWIRHPEPTGSNERE
jgi:hypothetical protein